MKNYTDGEILKQIVDKSGRSISAISKDTGIARSTIYKYFDEYQLKWNKVMAIIKVCGIEVETETDVLNLFRKVKAKEDLNIFTTENVAELKAKYINSLEKNSLLMEENQILREALSEYENRDKNAPKKSNKDEN